jgi:hypothetical protein
MEADVTETATAVDGAVAADRAVGYSHSERQGDT